jgi:hypothetical protein
VSSKRNSSIVVLVAALFVFAGVVGSVGAASLDNYGGVSYATQSQVKQLVYKEFGYDWRAEAMIRCIRRESGFNARAANWGDPHGGSFGLTQINGVHDPAPGTYATRAWIQRMWDPVLNLRQAHRLMSGSGLGPWGGSC